MAAEEREEERLAAGPDVAARLASATEGLNQGLSAAEVERACIAAEEALAAARAESAAEEERAEAVRAEGRRLRAEARRWRRRCRRRGGCDSGGARRGGGGGGGGGERRTRRRRRAAVEALGEAEAALAAMRGETRAAWREAEQAAADAAASLNGPSTLPLPSAAPSRGSTARRRCSERR